MQARTYLKLSIAVALLTFALKTAACWQIGSISLLSDALESLVNLAGAMFALLMVTLAAAPAVAATWACTCTWRSPGAWAAPLPCARPSSRP